MLSAYPPFGCSMFGTFSAPRFSLIFSGLESGLQEWRIWGPEHIKDEAYQSNFVCQNSAQRWDIAQKWMVVFVWLRGSWVTPMYLSTTLCGIPWTHLDLILNLIVNAVRFTVANVLMSHSLFPPPPRTNWNNWTMSSATDICEHFGHCIWTCSGIATFTASLMYWCALRQLVSPYCKLRTLNYLLWFS